jgi:hypothetical protein
MDILFRGWLDTGTTRFIVSTSPIEFERWLRRSAAFPGTRDYPTRTGTITLLRPVQWPPPHESMSVLVMGGTHFIGIGTHVVEQVLRFEIQRYTDEFTHVRCDCFYPSVQPFVASLISKARKKWAGVSIVPSRASIADDESDESADEPEPTMPAATSSAKRPTAAQERARKQSEKARRLRFDGLTRKEIAHELGVSISTVDNYLKQ